MNVEIRGSGPPVLLLHGIPGSRHTWSRVNAALERNHQTITPDLLGFGASTLFRADGHAEEQAGAVLDMLDRHSIQNVHAVGFDFGGPTAIQLYRHAPRRVSSLTLAATNVFTDTPIPTPLKIARVPLLGRAAFRLYFGKWGLAAMWAAATADRRAFPYRDFAPALASPEGVRTTRHIFFLSLRDLPRYYGQVEAILPRIAVEASVVWGDRDPFFPVEVGRRVAGAIPGATFTVLEGCGHFVPGERASEMATIIAATVSRAGRRPRTGGGATESLEFDAALRESANGL